MTAEEPVNFYVLLDLDPAVDDWPTIERRLEQKQREWANHVVQGAPARQLEAKRNLKLLGQIRADLGDAGIRQAVRAEARRLRAERTAGARRRLAEHVQMLRLRGAYTAQDLASIHGDLRGELPTAEIETQIRKAGVARADEATAPGGAASPPPRLNPTVQADIRRGLDHLKLRTLYDLLEMSPRCDPASLARQADEVYKHFRPLTDPDSTARSKLAGHARNLFSTAAEKQRYDNTVAVEAMERLHGLIDSAGRGGMIVLEALDRLVRMAVEAGVRHDDARAYIAEYAARKKWIIQPAAQLPSHDLKLCGRCSSLADRPDDTHCPRCHEPLSQPCLRCGTATPTQDERCGKCGFATGNGPLMEAFLASGRTLLEQGDPARAIERFDRALTFWGDWPPALELRRRAREALDRRAAEADQVRALAGTRRLVEALAALDRLERAQGAGPWADLRQQLESDLGRARAVLEEGEALLRAGESEEALAKYEESLKICADLVEAREARAACPPPEPADLDVRAVPGGYRLRWSPPRARGALGFRVLRKADGPPAHAGDGLVVAEPAAPVAQVDDTAAEPGRPWFYAVFTVRDGLASPAGASAGPFVAVGEVQDLRAAIGDGRVILSWKSPPNLRAIDVRRRPDGAEYWSSPLPVARGAERLADAGLRNEVVYAYRVACVFAGPDGRDLVTPGQEIRATPCAPPPRVTAIRVTAADGLRLDWTCPDPPPAAVAVVRTGRPPALEVGRLLPLIDVERAGRRLTEVGPGGGHDPAPDPGEPHYLIFSTNRLLATYCGAAQFVEVRRLAAAREQTRVLLSWEWPADCHRVEVFQGPEGSGPRGDPGTGTVVERHGLEPSGHLAIPVESLPAGPRRFLVRCAVPAGERARVAGPGQAVAVRVHRSREVRWSLARRFGFGPPRLVVEAVDGLAFLDKLILVGKVNELPGSPEDGFRLVSWEAPAGGLEGCKLALPLGRVPASHGEVICRLFAEPSDVVRLDDPPIDRRILS